MKHQFRITKYNPQFRNESGAYQLDEWTEYSDLGRVFNGVKFSIEEYEKVESAYIQSVILILEELLIDSVKIESLENRNKIPTITNGQIVNLNDLPHTMKLVLRENCWFRLRHPRRAFIHFGYDYYMYIGVSRMPYKSLTAIAHLGLYVETYQSPY